MYRRFPGGPPALFRTRPFVEPFLEVHSYFFVANYSPLFFVFQTLADLLEDIEVVLDVLNGDIVGKRVQHCCDILFGGTHRA